MSAFGDKADMTVCGSPLSRSLLGLKRTSPIAPHMSAIDPKRTFVSVDRRRARPPSEDQLKPIGCFFLSLGGDNEAARFYRSGCRLSRMADRGARAEARGDTADRGPHEPIRGRSTRSGPPLGIPARPATIGMERRLQYAD